MSTWVLYHNSEYLDTIEHWWRKPYCSIVCHFKKKILKQLFYNHSGIHSVVSSNWLCKSSPIQTACHTTTKQTNTRYRKWIAPNSWSAVIKRMVFLLVISLKCFTHMCFDAMGFIVFVYGWLNEVFPVLLSG